MPEELSLLIQTHNTLISLPSPDEVFFIDLPPIDARRQIFTINLQRRQRLPLSFDLDVLANSSKDLTGSEIEQSITSNTFHAFAENGKFTTEDILKAITEAHPLSSLIAEKIEYLRGLKLAVFAPT